MARPRLPLGKAEVSGATLANPGRFRDRKGPKRVRPIGDPYPQMTDGQKVRWEEFRAELPWLHSSDRVLLRIACILAARLDVDPAFGVQATKALSSIFSKLGASPTSATRVVRRVRAEDE